MSFFFFFYYKSFNYIELNEQIWINFPCYQDAGQGSNFCIHPTFLFPQHEQHSATSLKMLSKYCFDIVYNEVDAAFMCGVSQASGDVNFFLRRQKIC